MKLTFAFFKFKVPNFKQFLWNVGPSNMSESYRDAKAVLDNVKSSAWSFFKFRVSGEEIDKSFVHCKLCLDVNQHPGRAGFLLDGVAAQQTEAQSVWGECPDADVLEGQSGVVMDVYLR